MMVTMMTMSMSAIRGRVHDTSHIVNANETLDAVLNVLDQQVSRVCMYMLVID